MKRSSRYRALAATFGLGLGLACIPSNAHADPVTGQDHPGDVIAFNWHFYPDVVHIHRGASFKFANYDAIQGIPAHSLVQYIPGCTAPPYPKGAGSHCPQTRFGTGVVDWMDVSKVHGVEKLPPGTYDFVCQVHPFMRGKLIVE
jgi:plastocyanin